MMRGEEAMAGRSDSDRAQVRQACIVILVAMLTWFGFSALGAELDLPVRFAFLADMLCLAALAWALWVLFHVWRRGAGGE